MPSSTDACKPSSCSAVEFVPWPSKNRSVPNRSAMRPEALTIFDSTKDIAASAPRFNTLSKL